MTPAESIHEQIKAKLVAGFTAIAAGADYWYTPAAVKAVSFFPDEPVLDTTVGDVLYLLRPGDENVVEEATGRARAEAEFFLVVARQHRVATENPFSEDPPTRWTIVNRLVRDAVRCLLSDVTLSGLAVNVDTNSISIDRSGYITTWAFAELRFTVSYFLDWSAP
jgi:hypothetical protein